MGKSYRDYHKGLGDTSGSIKKWIGESITFVATSFTSWLLQKKWLNVVSGGSLEILISIGVGIFFSGIYVYFHHRHLLWRAAWEYSNQQEEEIAKLEKQLNVNVNYEEPDLHFAGAIELVKKLQPDKNYSTKEAQAQLVQKHFWRTYRFGVNSQRLLHQCPKKVISSKCHTNFFIPHTES